MMIVKSAGAGLTWNLAAADMNNDLVWRVINIDHDRYTGAYSGAAFTAWPGWRPDDIDAGDGTCEDFWRQHHDAVHGRGNTPQEAYRDLVDAINENGWWDADQCQMVVLEEQVYLRDSDEFRAWLGN